MKKIIAALMTAVMLTASVFQGAVFAAFSDVDDTNQYRQAITALTTLSVIDGYEDGTFRPDGAITRAEFTKLIVYILGFQDLQYSSYSFSDIEPSFWASNFVQTAYDRGIIVGFDDGEFKPNDPVTYAQALKMVVCTLGYEQFAMSLVPTTDGWADRYIQEAGQLGLTKNITALGSFYDNASRGMIAQLLYNALEIEMYEYKGYEWSQTEKTLLNDYLKVKQVKGTLVGVEDNITEGCKTALLEQQMDVLDSQGEEIVIDYSTYTTNGQDLLKYLGSTIKVYYRQVNENDERTLVSIDAESTKNTIIELTHDDLNSYDGSTLKYYDSSSKTKTAKLKTDDLTIRYNGKIVPANEDIEIFDPVTQTIDTYSRNEMLKLWLNPDTDFTIYGTLTLTDSGNDGSIDMIQIYDYDVIVAYTNPTTTDYRITDKLVTGNYLILDPQSADYTYTIKKNGADIPVTSISANDVILYAASLDGSMYTLLVSNETVKGTVSSVSGDGERMTVSGTSYDIGERCASYIKDKSGKDLKVGVSGTFYLDAFKTAVFGTLEETSSSPYGYIVDAYIDDDEGGKPYVTVYAPSVSTSETASYPLKSTIKLNGANTNGETAVDKIQAAAQYAGDESKYASKIYGAGKTPSNTEYAQPCRITISNKEVTDIVILTSDQVQSQNEDKEQIVKCKELNAYTYSSNSFTQNGKTAFSVNSSTVVLFVPADRKQKKQYARKTVSSAFTSGDSYYVEAYDINSSKIAGLLIYYANDGTLTTVKKDSDFSVVATLPEGAVDEKNDRDVQQFEVYTGSSSTSKKWLTFSQTEFDDIVVGDVIQFAYDSDNLAQGRINNIKFEDVKEVLDGKTYNDEMYNWEETQTPSEDNNNQSFKFDYRFKRPGTTDDETYTSSTLGTVPNSRAVIFNVSQVLTDENKIYVTKGGFNFGDDGIVLNDDDYEEISITSSTRILRMEKSQNEYRVTPYVADTTANLTISDLKDAKNYGMDCSKILVFMSKGNAKMIMIYDL